MSSSKDDHNIKFVDCDAFADSVSTNFLLLLYIEPTEVSK